MKTSIVTFIIGSAFSFSAAAVQTITCKTANRAQTVVAEYLVESSKSQRLASSVVYVKSTSEVLSYSVPEIAQFKSTAVDLFVLADDASGNPLFQIFAVGSKNKFVGAATEFTLNGAVAKNIAVICTRTEL